MSPYRLSEHNLKDILEKKNIFLDRIFLSVVTWSHVVAEFLALISLAISVG